MKSGVSFKSCASLFTNQPKKERPMRQDNSKDKIDTYLQEYIKRSQERIKNLERPKNYNEWIKLHKQIIRFCNAYYCQKYTTFSFTKKIDPIVITSFKNEMIFEKEVYEKYIYNNKTDCSTFKCIILKLSLIHISEPTRPY